MHTEINNNRLTLITGDITKQNADAIVNAANGTLMGGGGVDGAIHRAAGKQLLEACKQVREKELNGEKLATGQEVMTKGFELPADWVIHTVGPVWSGNLQSKKEQLANCYQNALKIAQAKNLSSIAFPSISTGVYRFPIDLAAQIALETIISFLKDHQFGEVVMVLFSEGDYTTYQQALNDQMNT
nr:O-acetyl-ADP-ribose deacetylase [Lentibacillus sp. JNUCC-1]